MIDTRSAAKRCKDSSWKWTCRKNRKRQSPDRKETATPRSHLCQLLAASTRSFHGFFSLSSFIQHSTGMTPKSGILKVFAGPLLRSILKSISFSFREDTRLCKIRTRLKPNSYLQTWSQRMVVHCLLAKTIHSRCLGLTFLHSIKHVLRVHEDPLITAKNCRSCIA